MCSPKRLIAMKKHLFRFLLIATCFLLIPVFLLHADNGKTLSASGSAPAAWLSVRGGDVLYTHDLRVVLAFPAETKGDFVTVTLTFEGDHAPATVRTSLGDLPLYHTVKAGGNTYTAAKDTVLRVLTVQGLADGSYTSVSLKLEQSGNTVYESVCTAKTIEQTADLTLTPWDGSLTDWMGALPDSRSIADLTIPGTHNSGADVTNPFSQCQSLSIGDQLAFGVRFLDIRLKLKKNNLEVYHGFITQDLSFSEVMADCRAFLAAHPGETLLMSIRQEDAESASADEKAAFSAAIAASMAENSDLWYTQNRIPSLGEVRGKIVLFRRYTNASVGINCTEGWADNAESTISGSVSMRVQDNYELKDKAERDSKWNKITALAAFAAGKDNTFCLNFTSGYIVGRLGLPDITTVSDYINPKLTEYFLSLSRGGYGTFAIDFITPEIVSALIATNFPG